MTQRFVVDAGPLVALLSERDRHHAWAKHAFTRVTPPVITCEAALAEAWHLLRGTANGQTAVLELLASGTVAVEFDLMSELAAVRQSDFSGDRRAGWTTKSRTDPANLRHFVTGVSPLIPHPKHMQP